MKKKLQNSKKTNLLNAAFLIGLLFLSNQITSQTTIFSDDFNRAVLSPGGVPSVNYTVATTSTTGVVSTAATGVGVNDFNGNPDTRVKITGGISAGRETITASMSGIAGFNAILNANNQLITWSFNIKHNRGGGGVSSLSGFDASQYGVGAVLACDKLNPLDPAAKGYAVVMGGIGTKNTYDLVSFQNGLIATLNMTSIITGKTLVDIRDVVSVNVTYDKVTNKWNMYQRDETAASTSVAFPNPYGLSIAGSGVSGQGEVSDTAGFVSASLPYFGMIFNHSTTTLNYYLDNYKVTLGQGGIVNYYVATGADCSNVNSWWTNTNGATGTHPSNFTADGQVFNIFNSGATIGSDWLVSGGGSKVVLGDGTSPNTLLIPDNAYLSASLKLQANTTITINHLTTIPSFESGGVDPSSTVIFNGLDAQNVPGSVYGNLSILTQGINGAKAVGAISVAGNLNIDANSILSMDSSKLQSVYTLSGTGILKTKYAFSGALPAGILWPYSVYYNYTSANTAQIIALGDYINLDTNGALTGSPRNFANDISISGSLQTGIGVMTAAGRITFNGASSQTIQSNFPPATALIISNTSSAGVSLSASEIVPDITNLELSGNLNADFDENFGTLSLLDNSTLTLGATPHTLSFLNSSASNPGPADFWVSGKTLTIKGWTGVVGSTGGSNGRIFVGLDNSGLTLAQLSQIQFEGYLGSADILPSGELVPASFLEVIDNEMVDFKFSPNPVKDFITVTNTHEITEVNLYNLLGQKVLETKPNQLETLIDMSSLSSSTYFLEVISNSKKNTVKVIKQ